MQLLMALLHQVLALEGLEGVLALLEQGKNPETPIPLN